MKKSYDPRHQARIKLIGEIFTRSFTTDSTSASDNILKLSKLLPKIDTLIEEEAPKFPIAKIAKIDAAILRLAVYELLFEKRQPPKVIIDEAIELAKDFGGEESPSFVNGVLGALFKKHYGQSS